MMDDVVTALNRISEPPDDEEAYASFLRGLHLVYPVITKAEVLRRHDYMQRDAGRE